MIEALLDRLRRELRPLDRRERRRAVEEARDHLLSFVEDEVETGTPRKEAERLAVERFGRPEDVAAVLVEARGRRGRTRPLLAVGVAFAAVLSLAQVDASRELGPRPSQAATLPRPTGAGCAAAWNAAGNARWQAYARRLRARRAYVGMSYNGPTPRSIRPRACVVKLWRAPRPGHWQYATNVAGRWAAGTVRFGTPWKPHTGRQRTIEQYANALVRPDGTIQYFGVAVPEGRGQPRQLISIGRVGHAVGFPLRLTFARSGLATVTGPLPRHDIWRLRLTRVGRQWFAPFTFPLAGRYGIALDGRRGLVLTVRGRLLTQRVAATRYRRGPGGSWWVVGADGRRVVWRPHTVRGTSRAVDVIGFGGAAVGTVSSRIHTLRIVPRFADRSRTLLVPNTGPLVASGRRLFLLPLPGGMLRVTGVRG